MKKSWRRFAAWVTGFTRSFGADILTAARFKIVSLYLVMGVVILVVAGYLIYDHILSMIQTILVIVTNLLKSRAEINQTSATSLITQSIDAELQKMNIAVGLWIVITMVISAYVLAGLTIFPIRRAMERQKRFIANVSHELRTPLSVMQTETEVMLLNKDLTQEELMLNTKSNLDEVYRMARITQFLLSFAQFEQETSRRAFLRTNVNTVVTNLVPLVEKLALERRVRFRANLSREPAMIRGDAVALEEMFMNLLKNAVNYTPAGGAASISVAKRGFGLYSSVVVTIQDTGIGIPKEDMPRLFEPFYRGRNALPLRSGHSSGLGLAIVKEIADLHRASIEVRSEIGKGTVISIKFGSIA